MRRFVYEPSGPDSASLADGNKRVAAGDLDGVTIGRFFLKRTAASSSFCGASALPPARDPKELLPISDSLRSAGCHLGRKIRPERQPL